MAVFLIMLKNTTNIVEGRETFIPEDDGASFSLRVGDVASSSKRLVNGLSPPRSS